MFNSPLLEDQKTKCVIMNLSIVLDNVGGYDRKWTEGAPFDAIITESTTLESTIASLQKEIKYYGLKVDKNLPLEYHTAFKRVSDGKTFRVKSDSGMEAPGLSALGMKQLEAEEYKLNE